MTHSTLTQARRVIVKVGSVLLVKDGAPRTDWISALAADVKALMAQGKEVLIVSSGAVALGRASVGIAPTMASHKIPLAQKQAASAVGQFHLFAAYYEAFLKCDVQAAQILLTMSETENRRMHLNARATLHTLLARRIVPIINENDTVSTGEIRFGDNDRLAVRVGQMVAADAVVLLSTVDGLYTADPLKDPTAHHIPLVSKIEDAHMQMAGETAAGLSTGGMKTKMAAAVSATRAGLALLIADGRKAHAVLELYEGTAQSTLFVPHDNPLDARRKWLQAHLHPRGTLTIDAGALAALRDGKSLLPIGVRNVKGHFQRGDAVEVCDDTGKRIGLGLVAYKDSEARHIAGRQSTDIADILGYDGPQEMIHRNDMVLT